MIECGWCRTNPQKMQHKTAKTFFNMGNVYVFDITSTCIHGKELLRKFTLHQKYRNNLTMKQVCDISEKLTVGQSNEIYGVNPINWEDSLWIHLSLVSDEEVISLSHAKVYVFWDSVLCFGMMNQNPESNTVWEEQLTCLKSSTFFFFQNFGHNWWWANGIRETWTYSCVGPDKSQK